MPMPALLAAFLLLTLPALAPAQPLHELLALIEQHNPELVQQRRLLDTAAATSAGDDAGVLALLWADANWLSIGPIYRSKKILHFVPTHDPHKVIFSIVTIRV